MGDVIDLNLHLPAVSEGEEVWLTLKVEVVLDREGKRGIKFWMHPSPALSAATELPEGSQGALNAIAHEAALNLVDLVVLQIEGFSGEDRRELLERLLDNIKKMAEEGE